ncbi:hypothetical protein Pan110_19680 [Gimesia panareensis]|nr:hypothetical protein Pan110_19680 [Gimesia panareensis]
MKIRLGSDTRRLQIKRPLEIYRKWLFFYMLQSELKLSAGLFENGRHRDTLDTRLPTTPVHPARPPVSLEKIDGKGFLASPVSLLRLSLILGCFRRFVQDAFGLAYE